MKPLVVFYSRTGTTRKVGIEIANQLKCEYEEIIDLKNRKGVMGYIFAGWDAMRKKLTDIKEISRDTNTYDLIIIGTPNWGGSICPAVRTFLEKYKKDLSKNLIFSSSSPKPPYKTEGFGDIKKVAFFCTMGGDNPGNIFIQMEEVIGKPISTLAIQGKELKGGNYINRIEEFVNKIKKL